MRKRNGDMRKESTLASFCGESSLFFSSIFLKNTLQMLHYDQRTYIDGYFNVGTINLNKHKVNQFLIHTEEFISQNHE